jgi:hypothetical protein
MAVFFNHINWRDVTAGGSAYVEWVSSSSLAGSTACEHRWQRQHADYGEATFDLKPGDVLADAGSFRFNAEKLYDPLDPPIGSCFKFVRSSSLHKRINLAFDSDEVVQVRIPAKTYDGFKLFSHRPDLQVALVVLPALMETLDFIKGTRDQEPLDDKAWFISIDQLVADRGGWDQSILDLAQKILESPIDTVIRAGLVFEEDE